MTEVRTDTANSSGAAPQALRRAAPLDTPLAYHQAWTSGDFDRAMTHLSPDVVCLAPSGRLEGAEAFRAFMGPFSKTLTKSELLAAFGDDATAVLFYDTETHAVSHAPPPSASRSSTVSLLSYGSSSTGHLSRRPAD